METKSNTLGKSLLISFTIVLTFAIFHLSVQNGKCKELIKEQENHIDSLVLSVAQYDSIQQDLCEVIDGLPLSSPLNDLVMDDKFGWRRDPFTRKRRFHAGVDFEGNYRDTVYATGNGIVSKARWNMGYGRCIIIEHTDSLESLYAHLSKTFVKIGDTVYVGQPIGKVGSTGRSTGSHLHYEIIYKDKKIDPCGFLKHLSDETNCN
tara:strand:- start:1018 stop:1635 length:618 start_codon:yes stop_codon:yes gene_type:complete